MSKFLLTCEHGGNEIPAAYGHLFRSAKDILHTHRGYDLGALDLFKRMEHLADRSFSSTTSRLLVELNRSLHHPKLLSEWSLKLELAERERLLAAYYLPYRSAVEEQVQQWIGSKHHVIHISVHSFTPIMDGEKRNADIGLLYDPSRIQEKRLAMACAQSLRKGHPDLRVRMNYPYRGTADGFTTYLRKCFATRYTGIELEVNQKWAKNNCMDKDLSGTIKISFDNTYRSIAN